MGLGLKDDGLRFVHLGDEFSTTDIKLEPGEWVHVAGTWDGNDVRLHVGGVEVASDADVFTEIPDTAVIVESGASEAFASGARSAFFDGLVDENYDFDLGTYRRRNRRLGRR